MISEAKRAYMRAYREANRERLRAASRARYAADPERFKAEVKTHRAAHPEKKLAWDRAYRAANAERVAAYHRDWNEANAERKRRVQAAWAERNAERVREYRRANAERLREHCANRRARILGAPVVEPIERAAIVARDKSRCHICGKRVPAKQIHLDHIVPLAAGGEHTARNLAVAHATCNVRKGPRAANDQLRLVG